MSNKVTFPVIRSENGHWGVVKATGFFGTQIINISDKESKMLEKLLRKYTNKKPPSASL